METTEYKEGQAVIVIHTNELCYVQKSEGDVVWLKESPVPYIKRLIRPATEEEILAELKKNGFKVEFGTDWKTPSGFFTMLHSRGAWRLSGWTMPATDTLKKYGTEALLIDQAITALNLAP